MNSKSLKSLRIGALVMGWLLFAGIVAGVWGRYDLYCHSPEKPEGIIAPVVQFSLLQSLSNFFFTFGSVFFAFLLAAVLRMIEKEAPVGRERAQRLMIICCLSYLADAIVRFCSFIPSLSGIADALGRSGWMSLLPFFYAGIWPFAPLLYTASIFVLFTHFTKMVTFESEVA